MAKSYSLRIEEECTVFAIQNLSCYEDEQLLVKLKLVREHNQELVHCIQELCKHWTSLVIFVVLAKVTIPSLEHMSERKPILFDKNLKSLYCSEEGIKHELD